MSIKEEKSWSVHCDWPTCSRQFEYAEYTIFGDGWDVEEIVTESGGFHGRDGESHYCGDHLTTWASDHEDGEPFPTEPYLLIHDGDTDDQSDDGTVTYREASLP